MLARIDRGLPLLAFLSSVVQFVAVLRTQRSSWYCEHLLRSHCLLHNCLRPLKLFAMVSDLRKQTEHCACIDSNGPRSILSLDITVDHSQQCVLLQYVQMYHCFDTLESN